MGVCTILGLTKKRLGSPQVEESAIVAQFKSLEAFTSFAAFKVEKRVPLPVQVPVTLSFYWETLHFFLHPVQYAIVEWGNLSETSFCGQLQPGVVKTLPKATFGVLLTSTNTVTRGSWFWFLVRRLSCS